MNRTRLALGLSLAAFPLAVQIPFSLLIATYDYPDILMRGADEVLTRFHAGGPAMVWTWYAYALCTLGLGFAAVGLPEALEQRGAVARLSVVAGVIAALSQLLGLLRWTLVVPFLASRWVEHPEQRAVLEPLYEVQHRLFGVMLGEHVGQLFMAVWAALVSVMLLRAAASRVLVGLGLLSAALFMVGLGAGLARAVPMPDFVTHAPLAGFLVWSVWAVAVGALVAWRAWGPVGAAAR